MKKDNSYYFYINGREVKDEDFCSINPDVKEEYDENGNIKINLIQYGWREIDTKPAFYLFCFSNGYNYAGSTKNMLQRLTQHYNQFNDFSRDDWHKKVGDLIRGRQCQIGKNKGFKYSFVCCTKIFVQYTSSVMAAAQLEKQWLQEIEKSGQDKLYYNTIFYYSGGGKIKMGDSNTNQIIKKAEETFKGRTILKIENFIPSDPIYIKEQKELIVLIKERVSKMPNNGTVIVTIKDLNFSDRYCAAKDKAQELAYCYYLQLVLPDIESILKKENFLPHVKSLRYRNGGPLTMKQVNIIVDGTLCRDWYEKNRGLLPNYVKDLPTKSGIYIITFPNGKKYIGSTNSIQRRVREHLYIIYCWMPSQEKNEWSKYAQWYTDAYKELGSKKSIEGVKIEYILMDDYKGAEKKEIGKYRSELLYNSKRRV